MQVNNTQDYITKYKRRVIAKSIAVAAPPQKRRTTQMFTSVQANGQDQYNKFVSAPGRNNYYGAPLGWVFTNLCCKPPNTGTLGYKAAYEGIQPYLA